MNVKFRKAEIEDILFLNELEKLSFPANRQNSISSLRLSIISPFQEVWIVELKKNNEIFKTAATVLYPYKKTLRIFSIAVMPEFKGEGIGHKLLEEIIQTAKRKGYLAVSLEADANNEKLVKWYSDHGFILDKKLLDYYSSNEDAFRMVKYLEDTDFIQSNKKISNVRNFIVVDNVNKWSFDIETAEVISAKDYLSDTKYQNINNARIFNMCNSYRYQSLGYYVSLLAAARDHRSMPNVTTIRDFTDLSIIRNIADDIDEIIQTSLKGLEENQYTLDICFGKTSEKQMTKLAKELYQLFESPLLRVVFIKTKEWSIKKISPISLDSLKNLDIEDIQRFAKEYFNQKRFKRKRFKHYKYDLAIMIDPDEKYPPSDKKALELFKKAAEEVGFYTEFITRSDYDRLPEFDALFIRETTTVNDYTYLFSRRAYAEGLVVIDDPWSIVKCSNKMYLYERMIKSRMLIPKTWMLSKGMKFETMIDEVNFPLVLKQPDGSFSKGMYKVNNLNEMKESLKLMYKTSDLIVAQEFLKSDFDWRIGALDGNPLFASKYYMARGHWQIYNWDSEDNDDLHSGDFETIPVDKVPLNVITTAIKACSLIGDGLYGVDLKEVDGKVYVIEINDNPNIDHEIEDIVLGYELYLRVMRSIYDRIEKQRGGEARLVSL
ncbi:MAG: GNAT family N-acetyltransferase [Candidatus Delongbacteria bacterium]|nr:GNAT family N-acetyltransferase [Candidatus Delongbacteria bacterium]